MRQTGPPQANRPAFAMSGKEQPSQCANGGREKFSRFASGGREQRWCTTAVQAFLTPPPSTGGCALLMVTEWWQEIVLMVCDWWQGKGVVHHRCSRIFDPAPTHRGLRAAHGDRVVAGKSANGVRVVAGHRAHSWRMVARKSSDFFRLGAGNSGGAAADATAPGRDRQRCRRLG